ncbi:hypothetical protein EDB92DRAFT_1893609 [Lactarius akahatsu]|uniref:Secreted protein n=1 Tax=Lactarius akahatsu TaxID=416441 RepID=A0AAD4L990_9AGAM|nr:hypothetical protein EDB92DRAFT_1893609 [Lactarius akahatsu]
MILFVAILVVCVSSLHSKLCEGLGEGGKNMLMDVEKLRIPYLVASATKKFRRMDRRPRCDRVLGEVQLAF